MILDKSPWFGENCGRKFFRRHLFYGVYFLSYQTLQKVEHLKSWVNQRMIPTDFPELEFSLHFLENMRKRRNLSNVAGNGINHSLEKVSRILTIFTLEYGDRHEE